MKVKIMRVTLSNGKEVTIPADRATVMECGALVVYDNGNTVFTASPTGWAYMIPDEIEKPDA